jgi:MFS family permease
VDRHHLYIRYVLRGDRHRHISLPIDALHCYPSSPSRFHIGRTGFGRVRRYLYLYGVTQFYGIKGNHLQAPRFQPTDMFSSSVRFQIWPITIPYIKTYRLPTPLLIFQVALIAGSFLVGFMLSPLLVYSRYIAQQPARRSRDPKGRLTHRRTLAAAFYGFAALIIGGMIGLWTRWRLGGRDPWLWAVFYLLDGRRKWSRGALLAYWGLLGSISVAGWTRQLARSRKYPHRSRTEAAMSAISNGDHAIPTPNASVESSVSSTPPPVSANALGLSFPTLPNLPNLPNLPSSQDVTNVLDAADKHVPTLSLNARRKFFHILAVVMFVPGIAIDVSHTKKTKHHFLALILFFF